LFDVYSHNAGLASFLFDELLRRGLIHVSAVAVLASEEQILRALVNEPLAYRLYEMIVDRALDFVRASVLERHRLGALNGIVFDESADLTPQDEPVYLPVVPVASDSHMETETNEATASNVEMEGAESTLRESSNTRTDNAVSITPQQANKASEEEEQVDFDEDQDADADGRRVRRRVEEDPAEAAAAVEPPREIDPMWIADEAWKSALRGSRSTYNTIVSSLLHAWSDEVLVSSGEREAFKLIAKSLLNRVWRGYLGLQRHLEHILAQRVVLGDHSIHAEVGRVLISAGEQAWLENWKPYLQQ
jgi:hypothetical protein